VAIGVCIYMCKCHETPQDVEGACDEPNRRPAEVEFANPVFGFKRDLEAPDEPASHDEFPFAFIVPDQPLPPKKDKKDKKAKKAKKNKKVKQVLHNCSLDRVSLLTVYKTKCGWWVQEKKGGGSEVNSAHVLDLDSYLHIQMSSSREQAQNVGMATNDDLDEDVPNAFVTI